MGKHGRLSTACGGQAGTVKARILAHWLPSACLKLRLRQDIDKKQKHPNLFSTTCKAVERHGDGQCIAPDCSIDTREEDSQGKHI